MPSRATFVSTLTDNGCWIEFRDGVEAIPVTGWSSAFSPDVRALGSKLLLYIEDHPAITRDDESVFVDALFIARLTDRELASANLPLPCPFILELHAKGHLASETFTLDIRWYRSNSLRVNCAEIRGIELSADGQRYVLTEPSYSLVSKVNAFNTRGATTLEERLTFWSELCELTGTMNDGDLRLRRDKYLQNLRVMRARRFTLDLGVGPDKHFQINPVLLSDVGMGAQESGSLPADSERPKPILTPKQQEQFTRNFFALSEGKDRCAVGDGTYVVFDESVAEALTHVRKMKDADVATQRAFISNPHGYLRATLSNSAKQLSDSFIERVENAYFETEGFSDRVIGIGAWQRPTLPWVLAQTQGWLPPDKVHIDVRSQRIEILTDDLPDVMSRVDNAIERLQRDIVYHDQTIPAIQETRTALADATEGVKVAAEVFLTEAQEKVSGDKPRGPFALIAHDNLESGDYSAKHHKRLSSSFDLPLINTTLKDHQELGVRWLQTRWSEGFRGALLADDMGLGKSLTVLSFLLWLRNQMLEGSVQRLPILMVVPTALVQNWIREHTIHVPGGGLGQPTIAYGADLDYYRSDARRKDVDGGQPSLRTDLLLEKPWIITTYETLRDYQLSFGKIPLAAVVFDEAQRIKNPGAALKNAAKGMNADFFIAATGTPVENRLADLWSIVDLIEPNFLGSLREFSKIYEDSPSPEIIRSLKYKVDHASISTEVRLRDGAGLMLRRMKDGTLRGLPDKIEHSIEREMSVSQAAAYDRQIAVARGGGAHGRGVLLALQGILTVSLHPDVLAEVSDEDYINMSARYAVTFEILDRAHVAKEKVLIFLEMLDAQPLLALIIQRRYKLSALPMIINGGVSGAKRQDCVDRFQSTDNVFDVMILSPRAGGVGLTLTKANNVIHLSRWWNPAVEDQCTDRVYRIGQEKTVNVYYLQAIHPSHGGTSFDAKLHELLVRKRGLSRELLAPPVCTDDDLTKLLKDTVA